MEAFLTKSMATIEDYLRRHASVTPNRIAVIHESCTLTYGELWQKIENRKEELIAQGLSAGKLNIIRSSQTPDYLITYFATHLIGAIVMPLESDIPQSRFEEICARYANCEPIEGTADVLFTTGTTGNSKGVMISHRAILADADNLIQSQGFTSELTFIICGPICHAGCWSKIFPIIMTGGTLYLLEGLKDLEAFYNAMESASTKVATFLVPSAIRLLIQFSSERLANLADKMDFIETGAAPISRSDMQTLCKLLPNSRLYNTYASTETGIVSTYNYNDGQCLSGCLGKPMIHSSIRTTPEGVVFCQGDTLMSGYLDDKELTAIVLHDNTVFTTDNGIIDEEGRLRLLGRADDVINVGGLKVAPYEVEEVALSLPSIQDCVCIAVPHPISGYALKLLVVVKKGFEFHPREIAQAMKNQLEVYKIPSSYAKVESINRTFNGKIDRKSYR